MDILYLMDRLENLIVNSRRMPLLNQILIKESDILNIVDQMRTSIPDELMQARRIITEKERIITQAQADASTMLARTREETERALNREGLLRAAHERSQEIVRRAEEHSQEIVRRAEEQAEQLKNEADGYVAETLRALRDHLANIEMDVGRSILSIEKGLESLRMPPGDGEDIENLEEPYEENEQLQHDSGSSHPGPRSSSLAADTMGGPIYNSDAKS